MIDNDNNNYNLEAFWTQLLDTHQSVDIAEAEFKRIVADDSDMMVAYRAWCEENDTTVRNGFADFAETYFETNTRVWDIIEEYDDDRQ